MIWDLEKSEVLTSNVNGVGINDIAVFKDKEELMFATVGMN